MGDEHNLERFVNAQEGSTDQIAAELRAGNKRSHWMWYAFPQIRGLGHSAMAQKFAIRSLEEARAYLAHPTLGARLREWTGLVLDVDGKSAEDIFGYPDYLKFRSSMTLFARAAEDDDVFQAALDKYYNGEADERTVELLQQ